MESAQWALATNTSDRSNTATQKSWKKEISVYISALVSFFCRIILTSIITDTYGHYTLYNVVASQST